MEPIIRKPQNKDKVNQVHFMTVELVKIYRDQIGDVMDEKIELLQKEDSQIYMVQNLSEDPSTFFILILNGEKSYGYWCVDESNITGEVLSFTKLFESLEDCSSEPANLESLIKKAI